MSKKTKKPFNKTMFELVFKCIKCDSIAYEVEKGSYYCPKCGFKWEIN